MSNIVVTGLINIETTLHVESFPLSYSPVQYPFFGIHSSVSGVGYNIAKALKVLGDTVWFGSMIGSDLAGSQVRAALNCDGLSDAYITDEVAETPQSIIFYDKTGRRAVQVDLKDIQEKAYPPPQFQQMLERCTAAALCNINFSRPFLMKARQAGKLVATDVHAISNLDDDYNRDFMRYANVLFMSHEHLPCSPEEGARALRDRWGTRVIVIGLGAQGALLSYKDDHFVGRFPAVYTRPVVNSIGAGDALFSAFLHDYARGLDPYTALRRALVFASYKIGERSAAAGFLAEPELDRWCADIISQP